MINTQQGNQNLVGQREEAGGTEFNSRHEGLSWEEHSSFASEHLKYANDVKMKVTHAGDGTSVGRGSELSKEVKSLKRKEELRHWEVRRIKKYFNAKIS